MSDAEPSGSPRRERFLPVLGPARPPALHVMSWNIRRRLPVALSRPADRWDRRVPLVREVLRGERPTIFAAQEVLPDQAEVLGAALGDAYRRLGHGRGTGGAGEACPIYYDADRLELESGEQVALSDTPARAGSTSWGNLTPRVMVSATFRDRATKCRFLAVNTHLDHLSARSRLRSVRAIRGLVEAGALPAVVMGDLNAGGESGAVRALLAGGALVDTWAAADVRVGADWGTYTGYRPPRPGGRKLDWVVVSPSFGVARAGVNPCLGAASGASDHLPVLAALFPAEGGARG